MKALLVGGVFDDRGGRASGYIDKLHRSFDLFGFAARHHNGGQYSELSSLVESVQDYDVVFWFADVPNDKPKLVDQVKQNNPRCCLVTSKRNEFVSGDRREYRFQQTMQRALKTKSNLLVQFWRDPEDKQINASVFDPLGNQYGPRHIRDVSRLARTLLMRVQQLRSFTRIGSAQTGDRLTVPDQPEFFSLIKRYAETFHQLLQPEATARFLGNASFRCARGFPSLRVQHENKVFVSRRNVDKRYIDQDAFVAVDADGLDQVKYYGTVKPSVDTPIQLRLYRYYHNVNYMLHGHVYVHDATQEIGHVPIPCGAVEEALPLCCRDRDADFVAINVRHHGCIVMAKEVSALRDLRFYPRPMAEWVQRS